MGARGGSEGQVEVVKVEAGEGTEAGRAIYEELGRQIDQKYREGYEAGEGWKLVHYARAHPWLAAQSKWAVAEGARLLRSGVMVDRIQGRAFFGGVESEIRKVLKVLFEMWSRGM